jgi:hypothetical protein
MESWAQSGYPDSQRPVTLMSQWNWDIVEPKQFKLVCKNGSNYHRFRKRSNPGPLCITRSVLKPVALYSNDFLDYLLRFGVYPTVQRWPIGNIFYLLLATRCNNVAKRFIYLFSKSF